LSAVGLLVGKPLGEVDGLADGPRLGDADGEADGLTLGLIVGPVVGLAEGDVVGANVEHSPSVGAVLAAHSLSCAPSQTRVPKQSSSSQHPLSHGSVPLHGGRQHGAHGPPQSTSVSPLDGSCCSLPQDPLLGLADGDVVGDTEGTSLGYAVGNLVGRFVGDVLGMRVGDVVGLNVEHSPSVGALLASQLPSSPLHVRDP